MKGDTYHEKALKVLIKETFVCGALGLIIYEVHDMTRAKIKKIKDESWREAWDIGYKSGYTAGRFDGLFKALSNKCITREEFDELIKEN